MVFFFFAFKKHMVCCCGLACSIASTRKRYNGRRSLSKGPRCATHSSGYSPTVEPSVDALVFNTPVIRNN